MGRRTVLAAALAAAALTAVAATSVAAVSFPGTLVSTKRVSVSTHSLIYYLDMRTTGRQEAFSVRFVPPRFATKGGHDEGRSLDGPRAVALQGPGTIGAQVQDPSVIEPCSQQSPAAFHGYATGASSVDLLLPPNSATTLAVRYSTGDRAPWTDGDFRLTFHAQPRLVGTYQAGSPFFGLAPTLASPFTTRTAGPTVQGRSGAHILLTTSPAGRWGDTRAPRALGKGKTIAISGRLLPALKDKRIDLRWRFSSGQLHKLASVRTDSRGRFHANAWRPPGKGTFELWASYPKQRGPLNADTTSCPLRWSVG